MDDWWSGDVGEGRRSILEAIGRGKTEVWCSERDMPELGVPNYGKRLFPEMCTGVSQSLNAPEIVVKPELNTCNAMCDYMMTYHNAPQECVTDAQCPDGVRGWNGWNDFFGEGKVAWCCNDVAEYMGTVCTMTDAQVTKAKTDAAFQQTMKCQTTNCATGSWPAKSNYGSVTVATASASGASLAFAFGVSPDPSPACTCLVSVPLRRLCLSVGMRRELWCARTLVLHPTTTNCRTPLMI